MRIAILCLYVVVALSAVAPASPALAMTAVSSAPPGGGEWSVLQYGVEQGISAGVSRWPQKQFVAGGWSFALFGREKPALAFLAATLPSTKGFWASEPILDFKRYVLGVVWSLDFSDCSCGWEPLDLRRDGGAAVLTVRHIYFPPPTCADCGTISEPQRVYRLLLIDRTWLGGVPRAAAVNEAPALFGPLRPSPSNSGPIP